LIAGASAIEKEVAFQHDNHLGYITSCPTNCGTGLRASVHIHLPNLGKDKAAFQAIADKFNVQIRGAHGEHTETDDHIYDISNKRRLGHSEASLVQDMYNGVKAMIDAELKLCGKDKAEPEQVFKYLDGLKMLSGKTIEDKLTAEETEALLKKIEEVEILDPSLLTADLTKEEDGSCSVQVLCQALAKHWWAKLLLQIEKQWKFTIWAVKTEPVAEHHYTKNFKRGSKRKFKRQQHTIQVCTTRNAIEETPI